MGNAKSPLSLDFRREPMSAITIDEKRLTRIKTLKSGSHRSISSGACIMEAVAYVAGEPWSDHPECVSPVIAGFLRSWNDSLPSDADRDRLLRPLIPQVLNTRNPELEQRRGVMCVDWFIREYTPAWLCLAGLNDNANTLSSLPEIMDFAQCPSIMPAINAAWQNSSAAWTTAWNAAWNAIRVTAWNAVGDVAFHAAWAAARAILKPTVEELQLSAQRLVIRMSAGGYSTDGDY